MQRVKAHNLRKLEEPKLVEELTKHRVSISCRQCVNRYSRGLHVSFDVHSVRYLTQMSCSERARRPQSQQGFFPTPGEAYQD